MWVVASSERPDTVWVEGVFTSRGRAERFVAAQGEWARYCAVAECELDAENPSALTQR